MGMAVMPAPAPNSTMHFPWNASIPCHSQSHNRVIPKSKEGTRSLVWVQPLLQKGGCSHTPGCISACSAKKNPASQHTKGMSLSASATRRTTKSFPASRTCAGTPPSAWNTRNWALGFRRIADTQEVKMEGDGAEVMQQKKHSSECGDTIMGKKIIAEIEKE